MSISKISRNICCWAIILICSATIVSCEKHHNDKQECFNRVVLVYMAAENTLSRVTASDMQEMLNAAKQIPDDCKLVVYVDKNDAYPAIYEIDRNTKEKTVQALTPAKRFDKYLDSSDPSTLDCIMDYTTKNYHASSYGIIFWSHGSSWTIYDSANYAKSRNPKYSFGIDTNHNTSNIMTSMNIADMASVLAKYSNIDFIMFDACFMQSIEVAYELRNVTKCIIGSPAEIPGEGAPYDIITPSLFAKDFNADYVMNLYNDYYAHLPISDRCGVLISAIDTKQLDSFINATSDVIRNHSIESMNLSSLLNYFYFGYWDVSMPDMYDIRSIMLHLLTEDEYRYWNTEFNKLVLSSYSFSSWYSMYIDADIPVDESQFGGVSMYLPLNKYNYFQFTDDFYTTAWGKVMKEKKTFTH